MIGRTRSIISGKSIKVEFTQFQDNETIERLFFEGALYVKNTPSFHRDLQSRIIASGLQKQRKSQISSQPVSEKFLLLKYMLTYFCMSDASSKTSGKKKIDR